MVAFIQQRWGWQGQGLDAGAAETSGFQLVSGGRGWGWSPGCKNRGQGAKGPGARGLGKGEVSESGKSSVVQEGRARGSGTERSLG